MKIVLFGANGQLGTALARQCMARDFELVAPTRQEVDVRDERAVRILIADVRPQAVINATGIVDIARCEAEPDLAFATNATAARTMAVSCAEANACLVQTSTHLVFPGTKTTPYVESDAPAPNSIYAASKLAGEYLALGHCGETYVVRFPTLFGTRRNDAKGFVEKMIELLAAEKPLRIADDRIDTPTWTMDAADAILTLAAERRDYGVYHIFNRNPVSYYDFVRYLAFLIGSKSSIERAKDTDFPSSPPKPLRVPLGTNWPLSLRSWEEALTAYAEELDLMSGQPKTNAS